MSQDLVRAAERLGAIPLPDGRCRFTVWAPAVERLEVRLLDGPGAPRTVTLERDDAAPGQGPPACGYHRATVADVAPGCRYELVLDGTGPRPDPASRLQPEGVHGPSQVVDPSFPWTDDGWHGRPLHEHVIYELHAGTFTAEGTFAGVIGELERLRELGITAIELMPVATFPGARNWGYDGVDLFAVHPAYGGPAGLRALVDACHESGLCVILDVVYNHLGPEGNYLREFGPYFTSAYHTPWGEAVNLDGPHSDEVRRFFVENACHWIDEYHIDGLRLDAVHALIDRSPRPFLAELCAAVHERGRQIGRSVLVFAESDANDPRLLRSAERDGHEADAVWADDLHHSIHALLTGERDGYYRDHEDPELLARAFTSGFAYDGRYSPFRWRRHGAPATDIAPERFVVARQNHDQIGNRLRGERLRELVGPEADKVAAALVLLSPHTPLLFMGEEYGETRPFLYFVSHTDPELVEAVRRGRRQEFASFGWQEEPADPQARATFERCVLDAAARVREPGRRLEAFTRRLIALRQRPAYRRLPRRASAHVSGGGAEPLLMRAELGTGPDLLVACFHLGPGRCEHRLPLPAGTWEPLLDTADPAHGGPAAAVPAGRSQGTVTLCWQQPGCVLLGRAGADGPGGAGS